MSDETMLAVGNVLLAVSGGIVVLLDFWVPGPAELDEIAERKKAGDRFAGTTRILAVFVPACAATPTLERRARSLKYGPFLVCWVAGVLLTAMGYGLL